MLQIQWKNFLHVEHSSTTTFRYCRYYPSMLHLKVSVTLRPSYPTDSAQTFRWGPKPDWTRPREKCLPPVAKCRASDIIEGFRLVWMKLHEKGQVMYTYRLNWSISLALWNWTPCIILATHWRHVRTAGNTVIPPQATHKHKIHIYVCFGDQVTKKELSATGRTHVKTTINDDDGGGGGGGHWW